jgi:mono/diheme cytochrome c family protein
MISQDVIHSFFVPAFRVKMDVLPGRYTTAWFTATTPGRYRLECAEFCGLDHSRMIGWIVVMEPAEFANWLATQGTQSMASQGERLFQQLGCNGCHRADSLARAPRLEGLYGQPVRLQDGSQVLADDTYIRTSIVNPSAQVVDGWQPIMPTFQGQLSEEQMLDLIAYIRSIGPSAGAPAPEPRPTPPPRPPVQGSLPFTPQPTTGSPTASLASQGERLFQQFGCNACHRPDNSGPAPSLVGVYGQTVHLQDGSQTLADDAYVRRSILEPGAQVVDGWQPIMPSFQGQLSEQQLLALIDYVRSIGGPGAAPPQPSSSASPAPSFPGSPTP